MQNEIKERHERPLPPMSKGDWIKYTALGIIVLSVLWLLYAGYNQLNSAENPQYPDPKYQPARDAIAHEPSKKGKVAPKTYEPYCQAPYGRDDADLCAQWAAVQAVGESNRLTRLSITITGFEFGALIVSLFFTGWAAIAAADAARAAKESVEDSRASSREESARFAEQLRLTQETLAALQESARINAEAVDLARREFDVTHRPRMRIRSVRQYRLQVGIPHKFEVRAANIGDAEATVKQFNADFFLRRESDSDEILNALTPANETVAVGGQMRSECVSRKSYSQADIDDIYNGTATLSIIGMLVYADRTGINRITSFFRVYDPVAKVYRKAAIDDPYAEDDFEN